MVYFVIIKSVYLDISVWPAKKSVAVIVLTNNHVTLPVESVLLVVRMDTLEKNVICVRYNINFFSDGFIQLTVFLI